LVSYAQAAKVRIWNWELGCSTQSVEDLSVPDTVSWNDGVEVPGFLCQNNAFDAAQPVLRREGTNKAQ
jgi:hypothetical protein